MDIIGFVKHHPLEIAAGVIGGIIVLRLFSGGSKASSGAQSDGNAAYFAAQSAEAQSGNALQAAQIETAATTAQTLIGANASVINNQTWAQAQMQGNDDNISIANINAHAAEALAPYQVQAGIISTLGNIASQPGTTVTSTSSNSGFFGLGASSSSSTNYIPDPAATNASNVLNELAGNVLGNSAGSSTGNHAMNG